MGAARLLREDADPLFFSAVKFLQASDDLPHVRAAGQRGATVVGRAPEHDPLVIALLDAFDDELVEQCGGAGALLGSMRGQAVSSGLADTE